MPSRTRTSSFNFPSRPFSPEISKFLVFSAMAVSGLEEEEEKQVPERNSKRSKTGRRKKLLLNERVEVRSEEDGFQGSWHPGTIISCVTRARYVKYDHILKDDGSSKLVDRVEVSCVIEGTGLPCEDQLSYRGVIRPLPPPLEISKLDLPYGTCVDVNHNDAWWEGVIFDHKDGAEKRKIFFPDIGDEMEAGLDSLRITQDWDGFEEDWHCRGMWLFLQLIEELAQEWYVVASVKQIWYDVREKKGFQCIKNWTYYSESLWKELVLEVIKDGLQITANHLCQTLDSSQSFEQESAKPIRSDNLHAKRKFSLASYSAIDYGHREEPDNDKRAYLTDDDMNVLTESETINHKKTAVLVHPLSVLPSPTVSDFCISSRSNSEESSRTDLGAICRLPERVMQMRNPAWRPVHLNVVEGAESCADAITSYAHFHNKQKSVTAKMCRDTLRQKVKEHLTRLGWRIELKEEIGFNRFRYFSPAGKCYHSLLKACEDIIDSDTTYLVPKDDQRNFKVLPMETDAGQHEQNQLQDHHPLVEASSQFHAVVLQPEWCPQAVHDWLKYGYDNVLKCCINEKGLILKVKKHLSTLGWSFQMITAPNKRRYMCYTSPEGKKYYSLRKACQSTVKEGGAYQKNFSAGRSMEKSKVCKEAESTLPSETFSSTISEMDFHRSLAPSNSYRSVPTKLDQINGAEDQATRKVQMKGKNNLSDLSYNLLNSSAKSPAHGTGFLRFKCRKPSAAVLKLKDTLKGSRSMHVLRSSVRVQPIVTPSSDGKPRTVLSWLIDNNVIMPRAKVHYCTESDQKLLAEGKISRNGIKCSCCGKLYTVSGFEAHAGSSCHKAYANLFLEDGRSLLDCQLQIKDGNTTRKGQAKKNDMWNSSWCQGDNDNICSICHYGGDLILCDQCPSSFHQTCLGLENVPAGEWFCPSCCCGICGEIKVREDTESSVDSTILSCSQCEQKYHVACQGSRGVYKMMSSSKKDWFCSKKCVKVFMGLHELLGKPIPVGVDNLTWTLVKAMPSDSTDLDSSEIEAFAERYSKLNVALGVMHECFEPVKESGTRSDLLEDVIFSKRSKLNRLNFQGFHTILLERNDELISVASLRIYGAKVAELPLVGTRLQYRRLGMCSILMNELEKNLKELGVERLILPAVPSMLHAWTTSFGFSEMMASERLEFINYTFLDFQDTIMCQKLLMKRPLHKCDPPGGTKPGLKQGAENLDHDWASAVSEVCQGQTGESGTENQGQLISDAGPDFEKPVDLVTNSPVMSYSCIIGKADPDFPVREANHNEEIRHGQGGVTKYYSRRRADCNKEIRHGKSGIIKYYRRRKTFSQIAVV